MRKQCESTGVSLAVVITALVLLIGWVMNVWTVATTVGDPLTGMFILRAVGILVAPLGAVLGYF